MTEPPSPNRRRREAKTQLDSTIIGIELTLISIIQGLALGVRLLRRRQDWILARAAQERAET